MEAVAQNGSSSAQNGATTAQLSNSSILYGRPTVADLHGENHFAQIARKNWLTKRVFKVRAEVVKQELWDELEAVDFAYSSLLVLENLQLLEKYLWPGISEDASNYHLLLLALMVNVKRRENLPSWGKKSVLIYCALPLTLGEGSSATNVLLVDTAGCRTVWLILLTCGWIWLSLYMR